MNNQNQNPDTLEAAAQDQLSRDFVAAALTVSVLVNLTVFVSWLTFTLA